MSKKLSLREVIAVASMLFGLFFGAGNLIFPVHMGQLAGANYLPSAIGFILTGVGLPLLGIAAMGISHSEGLLEMAGRVGKKYSVIFTCVLYLTIGPFFAIPRCATTSFTVGLEPLLPENASRIALLLFSLIFFALVLFFSLKPSGILTWIGKIINPIFLAFLALLVLFSLIHPMGNVESAAVDEAYQSGALIQGFLEGYNTMDVLASLAFGIVVIRVVRNLGVTEPGDIAASTLKAGCFTALLMALIYALTTLMGVQSLGLLKVSDNGGIALAEISTHYFGSAGQILLAVTIFLACLKTSIGLVTSCAETFQQIFPKVSYRIWTILFTFFSFCVANIGLTALIRYSVPVLMLLYPLAITLVLLSLFGKFFSYDRKVFVCVTVLTLAEAVMDFIHALPQTLTGRLDDAVVSIGSYLPLFSEGLGWIAPALLGLAIGLILHVLSVRRSSGT